MMKRTLSLLSVLVLLTTGLSALDLRLGGVTSGWHTQAAEAVLEGPNSWLGEGFRPEAGLEVGVAGTKAQVLVPLGIQWESFLERGWSWGVAVHGLAGTTVHHPAFVWGAEAELRTEWSWHPGIGLGLSAGVRYSGAVWEVPVYAVVEFALGAEDTLEPSDAEKKED